MQHHLPNKAFHLDSPSEVFEELSTLNPHKACGPDQICSRLLKEGAEIIASPLAELFNKSLSDGVLPLDWVSTNVTPVFKERDKHQASNYRAWTDTNSSQCKIASLPLVPYFLL